MLQSFKLLIKIIVNDKLHLINIEMEVQKQTKSCE